MTLLSQLEKILPEAREVEYGTSELEQQYEDRGFNTCRTATIAKLPEMMEVMRMGIKELKFNTDSRSDGYWNKGDLTSDRAKGVLTRFGSCFDSYNQTVDDVIKLLTN